MGNNANNASDSKEWYRLDNAAKIFPAVTNKTRTSVYRITIKLSEAVKIKELQEALEQTLIQLPYFRSELKKGFFWYWLEPSTSNPRVQLDQGTPCRAFSLERRNHLLMRILAKKNLISAEFMHVLTDGSGGMIFLLSLLNNYAKKCKWSVDFEKPFPDLSNIPPEDLYEDSYKKHFHRNIPGPVKISKAYHLPFKHLKPPQFSVIYAELSAKQVVDKAKKHQVSLTEYLGAIYLFTIQTIYFNHFDKTSKHKRSILRVEIPINLRNLFPSSTLRNFALFVMPEIDARLGEYTFEEIIRVVHHYMQLETDKKQIQRIISRNVGSEKNPIIRGIPLAIKIPILKLVYQSSGPKLYSGVLTNMGKVVLPKDYSPYIKGFRVTAPPSDPRLKVNSGLISYGEKMVISFGNQSTSKDFEQEFIRYLNSEGLSVKILNH
ncbi:MAG: hypothetical protein HN352_00730 [Bacteroidetes bacterium]|jgi:hypothetical protein|nr:hypothetical protein [Bacteroidota bacterium]MBT4398329.1 hypothetical protein [Bacteroidota bacterium]MBT4409956.1 hypothetical protein [Bacteroidota bacterium]MBT5424765.1 hypothetical protein [Bacteroidota bacterium]MBT7092166.1 hypothetical protein [Bacteroidota bacterium]